MINKVTLIGNLGRDIELTTTQSGTPVAEARVATSESYTDRDGKKQKKTEWHSVVLWGKLAETATRYSKKGSRVYVEGKIQTRDWEDREGNKRYKTEVVARQFLSLDSHGGGGERGPGIDTYEEPEGYGGGPDDDLPF